MSDVTQILCRIEAGDAGASEQLLPLVYDELRSLAAARMVAERPDHTLQATALVHEAYMRMVDVDQARHWESRSHFFAAAAEAMRRILVDSARRKQALKRGGDRQRVDIDVEQTIASDPHNLIELSEALEHLANEDQPAAELVKLRLFAGLSVAEAGEILGMSRSSAYENWDFARVWFAAWLEECVD